MLDYLIIFLITKFFIKDNLRRGYKLSVILGIIMIVNLTVYTLLVELIKIYIAPFKGFTQGFAQMPEFDTLRYALMGAVIIDLLLIIFLRKLFIKGIFKPGLNRNRIIENLVTGSLVTYALCEAVAIYGLLLFLIAGSSFDFYLFLVPCLVFLGIYFPRYSEWEGWIKQVEERVAGI